MGTEDHKLFSTPVSAGDGFRRADGKSWAILGVAAVLAGLIVAGVSLFVPKPEVKWPSSPEPAKVYPEAPKQPEALPDEPKTYDVAPRGAAPETK